MKGKKYFRKSKCRSFRLKAMAFVLSFALISPTFAGINFAKAAGEASDSLKVKAATVEDINGEENVYDPVEEATGSEDISLIDYVNEDGESLGNVEDLYSNSTGKYKASLEESYVTDSQYITMAKTQVDGTCWAYSATSAIETALLKSGQADSKDDLDLSEAHLIWFGENNNPNDTSDSLYGDGSSVADPWNEGGNYQMVVSALANWNGMELEENLSSATSYSSVDDSLRYVNYVNLKNSVQICDNLDLEVISSSDRDSIKEAIKEYGAVQACYYSSLSSKYKKFADSYDYSNYSCYTGGSYSNVDHAVEIIGWDDNFSASNFVTRPSEDGAWLIKNTWSDSLGYGKYFWLSYQENTLCEVIAYDATLSGDYDNNYQYDGSYNKSYLYGSSKITYANTFTAKSDEKLKAVGIYTLADSQAYTIKVYKNLSNVTSGGETYVGAPNTGTAYSKSFSGTIDKAGYHLIDLGTEISLSTGENFAVEVAIKGSDGATTYYTLDSGTCKKGQTYQKSSSRSRSSYTMITNYNACIKAFTVNDSADCSDLTTLYNTSCKLSESNFSSEDATLFKKYLAEAKAILAGSDYSQTDVNNVYKHLSWIYSRRTGDVVDEDADSEVYYCIYNKSSDLVSLVSDSDKVLSGGSYSFSLKIADGYSEGDDFLVSANGKTLEEDDEGYYTISNVTADQYIEVSGLVKDDDADASDSEDASDSSDDADASDSKDDSDSSDDADASDSKDVSDDSDNADASDSDDDADASDSKDVSDDSDDADASDSKDVSDDSDNADASDSKDDSDSSEDADASDDEDASEDADASDDEDVSDDSDKDSSDSDSAEDTTVYTIIKEKIIAPGMTIIKISYPGKTKVTFKWKKVKKASRYVIYIKKGSKWKKIKVTKKKKFSKTIKKTTKFKIVAQKKLKKKNKKKFKNIKVFKKKIKVIK